MAAPTVMRQMIGHRCEMPNSGVLQQPARPALVAWKCLECGGVGHKLDIRINGESQEEFEENAGEEYGLDAWPEAFGWISVSVSCTTCGKRTDDLVSYESM